MEEKNLLICYKCAGQVTIDNKQLGTCEECDSLIPLPAIIKNKDTVLVSEHIDKALEKLNNAALSQSNYAFHHAFNTYDRIIKINRSAKFDDYYPYWGKVLAQYGVVYRLNKKLESMPVNMRANYKSIYENQYYKKALEFADLNAQVLIKKEAALIEENQKVFLRNLVNFKPLDLVICVDDSKENPNREKDLEIAVKLEEMAQQLNLSYRTTYQDFIYHNHENWNKDPLACMETTEMMIVVSTDSEHLQSNVFKNMWYVFYKDQSLKETMRHRLVIITEMAESYDIDQHFVLTWHEKTIEQLSLIINENFQIIKEYNQEVVENEIHYPFIESLLNRGEFEKAREQIKEVMATKENDYSLYRLAFLAKKMCQNEEEIITKIIDARNDQNYLTFYVLAPRAIKRKYYRYLALFLEKVETLEEIDEEYEQQVSKFQRLLVRKSIWSLSKWLLIATAFTFINFLTFSLAQWRSILIVLLGQLGIYAFVFRIFYKNIGLGKIPEELKNEIDIKKYYHKIRQFLPAEQGAPLLANPRLKKMKAICWIFLCITLLFTISFFVKEGVVSAQYPNLQYRYRFDEVIITGGYGRSITIPPTIAGRSVVKIDDYAFYQNSEIEEIIISFGITEIGNSAFKDCVNLKEVVLPGSLEKVGNEPPFKGCNAIKRFVCPASVISSNKVKNYFQLLGPQFNEEMLDIEIIN